MNLYESDREDILIGDFLNDRVINATLMMMKTTSVAYRKHY